MKLEFDQAKSDRNLRQRGLSFRRARELLEGDPVVVEDSRRDYRQRRLIAYGNISGRPHVCVFTMRGTAFRIISLAGRAGERSMPLVRMAFEEARRRAEQEPVDWARIDAMTDEDIARQIAEDPDVAPDMSEALARGEFVRVHIADVYGIRTRMGLSHEAFAERFGLSAANLKDWESMGGVPDEAIRTYLRVIEREPEAVARAIAGLQREESDAAAR